ncbi:hypothetical protein [Plantactinospora endophytica]|nr:hypothetical protein [Plantactinospora endophytica]
MPGKQPGGHIDYFGFGFGAVGRHQYQVSRIAPTQAHGSGAG